MSLRRIPDPVDLVADRGGVVRVAALTDGGVGRRALEAALRSGRLLRVRRGWVATSDADPVRVAAAREGVVITCISQASRLGLWVHEADPLCHVGADPRSAGRTTTRAHVHWFAPLVPRPPDAL